MRKTVQGLLLILAISLSGTLVCAEEALSEADRADIKDVIRAQIDAFRADDGERAFSYASPDIRRLFGDATTFMSMVRSAYRPVYRPREFSFMVIEQVNGHWFQLVRLIGPDGRRVNALYDMELETNGTWRINGCYLVEADDESV